MQTPRIVVSTGLALTTLLASCATQRPISDALPPGYHLVVDGDTADWPADAAALATEHYLFLRFTVDSEQFSLQASPKSLSIFLDTDSSAATGRTFTNPTDPRAFMGVDLEVEFSPRRDDGTLSKGAAVYTYDTAGNRTRWKPSDFDLAISPTYASSWYELRISRTPQPGPTVPGGAFTSTAGGPIVGLIAVADAQGTIVQWADALRLDLEPACAGGRSLAADAIPTRPADTVRVLSWNVERSSPVSNPEPFRRVLRALDPDVLLLQEWEIGDDAAVSQWLGSALPGTWHVVKAPGGIDSGGGVLVASRYPLTPSGIGPLASEESKPIRFVSGRVSTSWGDVLVGSAHLKCCGSKDSREDRQRLAEARAINEAIAGSGAGPGVRIIAGDMNLVGGRPPLDVLRASIDMDGTDLSLAPARTLGDATFTTWRDPASDFPPGRLDFMVYSDSTADVVNAFTLDTDRLMPFRLEGSGLTAADSQASDHFPIVVDLRLHK